MHQQLVTYYAVLRKRGKNWNSKRPMRQQEQWEEHAAFMDSLAESGSIVLGGPLGPGEKTFLLIMAAEDAQAAEVQLVGDPWTWNHMLRIASIEPLEVLLRAGEQRPTPLPPLRTPSLGER